MEPKEEKNETKPLKHFKDIKSLQELKFDEIELIRGETPLDIEKKCLQLCKDYLSGNWSQQTVDTIEVRRVTGGMINQLYYCGIKEPDHSESVPQEVAVRFYGYNWFDNCKLRDVVISLILSEECMGPKIYGLFETGQIQKFYHHRIFSAEEHQNQEITEKVMRNLARFHCLNVPIERNPNWKYEFMVRTYEEAFEKFAIKEEMDEYNCETLKCNDLKAEMDWIKGVIERAESPVVFAHNDFKSSNLMITPPNDELVICDFDLSTYFYRGHDFVTLMREWAPKYSGLKPLETLLVVDSQFIPLIEIYVKECEKIFGKSYSENEINSVEHIRMLANDGRNGLPINRKLSLEMSDLNLKNYFTFKRILIEQNVIDGLSL